MAAPEQVASQTAAQQSTQPAESNDMRQLRDHAKSLEADLKALRDQNAEVTSKLTALEREKMTEVERITAERDDARSRAQNADKLQAENLKYAGTIESIFNTRLSNLPAEVKPGFEAIAGKMESPADKLEALTAFEASIAAIKPTQAGTNTQPTTAGTNTQPVTPANSKEPVSVKDALSKPLEWKPVPGQPGFAS